VPETKKWACAHWCVSPNAGTYTTVSNLEYTLVEGKRQTMEGRFGGLKRGEAAEMKCPLTSGAAVTQGPSTAQFIALRMN